MCTAATYKTKDFYFGRTLDYDFSYGDEITITPRRYPMRFRQAATDGDYAIIGMAHISQDYPLYYDAVNEKGLAMAGLNFVGNAVYNKPEQNKDNIAQFEFIPWILRQCKSVRQVKELLKHINITGTPFSANLPAAQLHWLIADRDETITVESVKDGLKVYHNPVGVLTNNPTFDIQMFHLNNYMSLSPKDPQNHFSEKLQPCIYSRGLGALGLPGDLSSQSRFVRVAFTKMNSVSGDSESESVSQFFHILGAVQQQRGCCDVGDNEYEITIYTSCCNTDKGIYYYTTYDNHQITAINMHNEDLNTEHLIRYSPITKEQIYKQN